ncbi:polysaccharide lyase 6 family protein [Pedobacter sp. MC2016-14]|uniref:polysaccharide lyase 6 family protein n=1 Tax=Pedobacter sp. MC2016-14 TaxID=2897327 RepID=UPI001E37FCA4|nr:polysaccharide lyase 6 family protein [Pedobacter sp. MC2016-14]MCD0489970.1 polysaccharide lyase 6 family protein [Pedobacter sp. MC2016-14]
MKYSVILLLLFASLKGSGQLVHNGKELQAALAAAKPGAKITMADGLWKDQKLVLKANGTAEQPIRVAPQTPGGVVISGASNFKISGTYLEVADLHFNNGYSPNGDLIIFSTGTNELANYCRITGFVIENFSQADRFKNDNWIVLWGKHNRVDHCTLINKINLGPTLIVELNDERSQQNYHSIDHNYFKGRQRLGSNGGETMRIGVSRYSLTPSRTSIKNNYFEQCNGEVEVVSVKSGENQVSFNTFSECEGSLVLRHGSANVVEGNVFLGNNKPFTGGVRVINPGHKVFNNVFKDLKGDAFRAALAVMNGVPNSAINRYYQVKDADIYQNTFINCAHIDFGTGKDAERTAAPENVQFRNNLVLTDQEPIYTDYNLTPGLSVKNNAVGSNAKIKLPAGFEATKIKNKTVAGLSLPQGSAKAGADLSVLSIQNWNNSGASWYRAANTTGKVKGKKIGLKLADVSGLSQMLTGLNDGDTLVFAEAGHYKLKSEMVVKNKLVFMAAPALAAQPVLVNVANQSIPAFISIENGGELKVKGLAFSGTFESFGDVQAGIRSTDLPMNRHYSLFVEDCHFYNFNESTFSAIKASKSTFADSLVVINSKFSNLSGTAIDFSAEKEDKGIYNAENTLIQNCVFTGVLGSALNLYRGGNDESTLGPFLIVNQCTFNEVDNREKGAAMKLQGVQHASILNSIFYKSGQGGSSIKFEEYIADDLKVDYCNFYQSGKVNSTYGKVSGQFIHNLDPAFVNPAAQDFRLKASSPLLHLSSAKAALGANLK